MRRCRRGGVVFGRGCRRVRGGRLWCGGWNEYRPRRRRTDYWLGLVGVFVDNRDPKLRRLVYVVVFPARVKTNANNSVPRVLAIEADCVGHGCGRSASRPECPSNQFIDHFPVAYFILRGLIGLGILTGLKRLTRIEDVNSSLDDGRGSHIVGRGCRNGSVDSHGDRQAGAFLQGTGRRDALKRNHRAGGGRPPPRRSGFPGRVRRRSG